jgi:hypothetical protein
MSLPICYADSSYELQARLDQFVENERRNPSTDVAFERGLPKPLRFAKNEIRNLVVERGKLTFDTECDRLDFNLGSARGKSLREALWQANFRSL